MVSSYRLPIEKIPAGAEPGEHFQVKEGNLVRIQMSPARLRWHLANHQRAKAFDGLPLPETEEQRKQRTRDEIRFMLDRAVAGRKRRGP